MNEQGHSPLPNCDHILRAHKLCVALNDIMMPINFSHDVDEIFHKVMDGSCKALGCESARIAMREGDNWVIRYVSNLPDDHIGRHFTDEELPLATLAMTTRKPVAIDDAYHDDRTNAGMMESLGIKSALVLPLIENDVVTGTLMFGYHSRAVSFSDAETDYAERMTTGIAIAIQNARLHQNLEESKRLGDALNEIDTVLYSTQDYDAIMNQMLQLSTDVIGAESAVIFSKEEDRWMVRSEYKLPMSLFGQNFSNTEVMHTAITAGTKRSLVVQDVANSPEIDQKFVEMLGIRSLLDFPLIVRGEVIGDLTFHYHSSPVPFNERQVEFVRKLQISITLALENSRLLATSKQNESKLKEAENTLRFSEERYRALFRDNPSQIVTTDGGLMMLSVNPACASQLGYTINELEGQSVLNLFYKEDRLAVSEQLQKCLQNPNQVQRWQFRKIRKDGEMLWVEEIAQAVYDRNGVLNLLVVCQDITERKRAEVALRASEKKFSTVFQATPSVLAISSQVDGRYMEVNEAFERLLGYRRDEAIGQSSLELNLWQNPEDRATVLRMLAEGKTVRDLEIGFRSKSGTIFVGLYSAEIIAIGAEQCLLSLLNDITARKKAEDSLRHGEERYRRLYNETPVMLHSIDHDGRLVSVSNYWLETLGYERDEVLGRISTEFYTAASRSYATEVVLPEFFRTGFCKEVTYQMVKKNGEIRDVLLSAIAERDSEGKVVRSLAVSIDVTDRKRAEEEIARLNVTLAARAAELEDANRELEAFNYTVAHDLRQPLNVVGLSCQALKELYGGQLPEECLDYIQDIYNGVLRMNELIEALQKFSRMGHVELHREKVFLCKLAQEAASLLKQSEPGRQVNFRIADGITADADAKLVRVVLDNLLGNAWKYTGMREKAVIEFGTTETDGKPVYFVRDNGVGFDKAAADKLFLPFQRLPGAEEFKGSGIGLATVERIIQRHGGRLWAEGEPDRGATFYFTLSAD